MKLRANKTKAMILILILICLFAIRPILGILISTVTIPNICQIDYNEVDNYLWIEAEDANSMYLMSVANDVEASGGKYVHTPDGIDPTDEGYVEYNIIINVTNTYRLWGRVHWLDGASNSFSVAFDREPFDSDIFGNDDVMNQWHWIQGLEYNLSKGAHILKFKDREDGSRLDKILITNDPYYIPQTQERIYYEWIHRENTPEYNPWPSYLVKDSLYIHWTHLPFHVFFLGGANHQLFWKPNKPSHDYFAIRTQFAEFGDSPDWELLWTDETLEWLEVVEDTNEYIKVKHSYYPCKNEGVVGGGSTIYRGNTLVEEYYTFYLNGLCERELIVYLGDDLTQQSSDNTVECAEWMVSIGEGYIEDVIGRDGVVMKIMDPWSNEENIITSFSGAGYYPSQVNSWDGVIHAIFTQNPDTDMFIIWGNSTHQEGLYHTIKKFYGNVDWGITSAILTTDAPLPLDHSGIMIFRWLQGMGNFDEMDLRLMARAWMEQGEITVLRK